MKKQVSLTFVFLTTVFLSAPQPTSAVLKEIPKIRAGHFPNITHAPALVGQATGRFEKTFKNEAEVEWKLFNAGPEAVEALAAGAIDILYVGPNPAINGFVRSKGDLLRAVSGVASGGSAFIVSTGSGIEKFEDLRGKRVATPQLGNTQDVALRHLLREKGLKSKAQGGNVEIFNLSGADQLTAILKNQVDAVWAIEPWVSRLVSEAGAKILFDEKELWPDGKYATTLLVVRKQFLDQNPTLIEKWVDEHAEITRWMNQNQKEAKQIANEELKRETGKLLSEKYLDQSFERIQFTEDPMETSVRESAERAFQVGFLGKNLIDLTQFYDLSFLKKVQKPKE